ncbi:MAG TPA: HlyD family secretion protein [Devosiaceae bacterium]|jgi:membrane fusion protein (multidrug efflux system)
MNARVEAPKPGEAEVVQMPKPEAAKTVPVEPEAPKKPKRRGRRIALMVVVPLVLIAAGGYFWLTGGRYVETDNAYVQQSKVAISADIAGRVISVAVHDNQVVKAGDVLFNIDPAPYRIALDQANAALASARVNVDQLRVAYTTAQTKLKSAQDTLEIRQRELDRQDSLAGKGVSTAANLDDVKIAYQSDQGDVALAQQDVASAVAALGGNPDIKTDDHPAVMTALAAKESAERDLAKTTVVAPADGIISQVASLNVGQFIATGTTIAALVETGDTWVEANFKETQLATLVSGQPAEVSIDSYPGVKFEGTLESLGAATGAEFALIPAQNATGNWVKVTQRIPVRIKLDEGSSPVALRSGMSATVSVDTGKSTLDLMLNK